MFSVSPSFCANCGVVVKLSKLTLSRTFFLTVRNSIDDYCPNLMRGIDYLKNPQFNKGLAFTMQERQALGIQGLIAANYKTVEEQIAICQFSVDRYKDPLNKYLYLTELQDNNERLFYELLATDVQKFLPIVYTPIVGLACQRFGLVYRRPRGLFITIQDKGRVASVLRNWPVQNVRAIVVTDGERILGLGDLGAYGMGIPVGKLTLYTALAGVPPAYCLPITLDVGTNTQHLLEDPMYIGIRRKRARGEEFDSFIEEFMRACVKKYGQDVLIQFEDFALANATRLLAKYQKHYCTFNDDIQGTASVIVAGVIAATRVTKRKISDNVYLFLGAGSAGVGIANLLVDAMKEEGVKPDESRKKIYLFDVDGLLAKKRKEKVPIHAKHFAKDMEPTKNFEEFVVKVKATCLIGVSTVPNTFTPTILKQMAKNIDRPMIFALSNPTHKSECTAQAAYDHTEGRCIFASGSPFPPVKFGGKKYYTGQGNNSYVYPGIALGVLASFAHHAPDPLFLVAAKTLASNVSDEDLKIGRIYPSLGDIKCLSVKIAAAVMEEVYKLKLASLYPKPKDCFEYVLDYIYNSSYQCYAPELKDYPPEESGIKVKSIKEMIDMYKAKNKKK
ncbi:unnamed protein product [Chrysodeixis includens]|uniref:Malic enzyme n=1 Tax=Chrysodeixis includens TaxID=689277 RepID=A0A9P0BRE9_CHRIL|nr:unnamed protein product [Chrysodeixis includens]